METAAVATGEGKVSQAVEVEDFFSNISVMEAAVNAQRTAAALVAAHKPLVTTKSPISFVIPKNKLSGALVPVNKTGGKWEPIDPKKEEEVKTPARRTKWDTDPLCDVVIKKGRALALQTRAEQIAAQLELNNLEIDTNEATRSPSPPPIYDSHGQRTNTREGRRREQLELERREDIGETLQLNPLFKPPAGWKPILQEAKLFIPVKDYPGYNFIGLILGPRGNTQKRMEQETGCKIAIRGKGAVKDGKMAGRRDGKELEGANEELHVHICADTIEKVDAAVALIQPLLTPVDETRNNHKRKQLRELAEMNGTMREFNKLCTMCGEEGHREWQCPKDKLVTFQAKVSCQICGDGGHPTVDCPQKKSGAPGGKKLEEEFMNFMEELGEGLGGGGGAAVPNIFGKESAAGSRVANTQPAILRGSGGLRPPRPFFRLTVGAYPSPAAIPPQGMGGHPPLLRPDPRNSMLGGMAPGGQMDPLAEQHHPHSHPHPPAWAMAVAASQVISGAADEAEIARYAEDDQDSPARAWRGQLPATTFQGDGNAPAVFGGLLSGPGPSLVLRDGSDMEGGGLHLPPEGGDGHLQHRMLPPGTGPLHVLPPLPSAGGPQTLGATPAISGPSGMAVPASDSLAPLPVMGGGGGPQPLLPRPLGPGRTMMMMMRGSMDGHQDGSSPAVPDWLHAMGRSRMQHQQQAPPPPFGQSMGSPALPPLPSETQQPPPEPPPEPPQFQPPPPLPSAASSWIPPPPPPQQQQQQPPLLPQQPPQLLPQPRPHPHQHQPPQPPQQQSLHALHQQPFQQSHQQQSTPHAPHQQRQLQLQQPNPQHQQAPQQPLHHQPQQQLHQQMTRQLPLQPSQPPSQAQQQASQSSASWQKPHHSGSPWAQAHTRQQQQPAGGAQHDTGPSWQQMQPPQSQLPAQPQQQQQQPPQAGVQRQPQAQQLVGHRNMPWEKSGMPPPPSNSSWQPPPQHPPPHQARPQTFGNQPQQFASPPPQQEQPQQQQQWAQMGSRGVPQPTSHPSPSLPPPQSQSQSYDPFAPTSLSGPSPQQGHAVVAPSGSSSTMYGPLNPAPSGRPGPNVGPQANRGPGDIHLQQQSWGRSTPPPPPPRAPTDQHMNDAEYENLMASVGVT